MNKRWSAIAAGFVVGVLGGFLPYSCNEDLEYFRSSTSIGGSDVGVGYYSDDSDPYSECVMYIEVRIGNEVRVYSWVDEGCRYAIELDKGRPPDYAWSEDSITNPDPSINHETY